MHRLTYILTIALAASGLAGLAQSQSPAQTPGQTSGQTSAQTKPSAGASSAAAMPTDAQIADAKTKGMVWANSNTKVYHKDDAFFGKTKHGKFMTEADAQKAGYKLAKASPIGQKKAAAAPATTSK